MNTRHRVPFFSEFLTVTQPFGTLLLSKSFVSGVKHEQNEHSLVLLSQGKNMKAENFDFEEKKQKYFRTNGGISPFVLTTQVLRYHEWTPATIEQRQSQLIEALRQLWKL